jgi:hypothetical protein
MNAQLVDALSDWRCVSDMSEPQAGEAQGDSCSRTFIL